MGITSGNAVGKERPINLRKKRRTVFALPGGGVITLRLAPGKRDLCIAVTLPDGTAIRHESLTLPTKCE